MKTKLTKVALALGAASLLGSGYAFGGAIACNGIYANTTLDGNVVVRVGMTCTLENVTVTGNLDVKGGTVWFIDENEVFGNVAVTDADGFAGVLRVGCEGCGDTLLQIGSSTNASNLKVRNSFMSSARNPNFDRRGDDTVTVFGNVSVKETAREEFRATISTLNVNATGAKPKLHNLECEADDGIFDAVNVSGNTKGDGSCVVP